MWWKEGNGIHSSCYVCLVAVQKLSCATWTRNAAWVSIHAQCRISDNVIYPTTSYRKFCGLTNACYFVMNDIVSVVVFGTHTLLTEGQRLWQSNIWQADGRHEGADCKLDPSAWREEVAVGASQHAAHCHRDCQRRKNSQVYSES